MENPIFWKTLALLAGLLLLTSSAWGQTTVVYWDFDDESRRTAVIDEDPNNITLYTADVGTGILSLAGPGMTGWVQGAVGTDRLAPNSNGWDDGKGIKYWMVTTSTTDFNTLILSSTQRGSNTGPRDFKVQYSTDGTNWTDVPDANIAVANNFTSGVLDEVELPEACEDQETLHLRWIMTSNSSVDGGTVASAGTNRIDGIHLTGQTEDPILTSDPNAVASLYYVLDNGPSGAQSFELTGINLNGTGVTITAPDNFKVSQDEATGFGEGITLADYDGSAETIWVQLKAGLSVDTYSGYVLINGGGANPINVAVSGAVTLPLLVSYPIEAEDDRAARAHADNVSGTILDVSQGSIIFDNAQPDTWTGPLPYAQGNTGWGAKTATGGKYFYFNVFASPGHTLNIAGIEFEERATGAGPSAFAVFVNGINIEEKDVPDSDTRQQIIPISGVTGQTQVEFWFAGWDNGSRSTSGGGQWRVNDFKIYGSVHEVPPTVYTGTGNWNDVENWSDGVPGEISKAVVEGEVTIATTAEVLDLIVENEASLTITSSGKLSVYGSLSNNAGSSGLIVQSDASGTGSLVHNNDGVVAAVERYIEAVPNWPDKDDGTRGWHFVSSPVGNQSIEDNWTPTGEGNDYDFYAWDEAPPGTWLNQKVEANEIATFIPGKAYLVAYQQPGTKEFAGALNNGDVIVSLQMSGGKAGKDWTYEPGWNLIGNPYPSAIDWNGADHDPSFQNVFAYIYDRTAGNGGDYTMIDGSVAGSFIPAHQGFFVLANENPGDFTFTNDMRGHGSDFMKEQPVSEHIRLRITKGDFYSDTRIRIHADAGHGTDRYDAHKLFILNPNMPQVYSFTEDQTRVAINSIPHVDEELPVGLGLRVPADGEYTLSVQEVTGVFGDVPLYLEDLETEIIHDLYELPEYRFVAGKGDHTQRFVLHFAPPDDPTGIEGPGVIPAAMAWYHGGRLYVEGLEEGSRVHVYDVSGRLLRSYDAGAVLRSHQLELPAGVYVVRLPESERMRSVRIVVK